MSLFYNTHSKNWISEIQLGKGNQIADHFKSVGFTIVETPLDQDSLLKKEGKGYGTKKLMNDGQITEVNSTSHANNIGVP